MGDFSANFHRPEAGINTVEGTKAGSRAAMLERKRKQEQEEFEKRKKQIGDDRQRARAIADKFAGGSTTIEEKSFKEQTVGLVSREDFVAAQAAVNKQHGDDDEEDDDAVAKRLEAEKRQKRLSKKEKKKRLKEKKKLLSTLSFAGDEEGGADEDVVDPQEMGSAPMGGPAKQLSKKDPNVDTSFLPDKARDETLIAERKRLEKEWLEKQRSMKAEKLEIIYSYWDGSGHRRSVVVTKGDTIGDLLEQVRATLVKEFRELSTVGADGLLYIKEDLIIPQDLTFYDLIATKARGKSGPLFHFDVHDDVRVGAIDSRVEKDESHPGKVVERRWYDRNKHIFPASRWEIYDPKKDYGSYSIGDFNKKND